MLALRETPATYPTQPRLLDRVRNAIRARHYSRRTEKAYTGWIKGYIALHGKRHPADMGGPEVAHFLTSLAVDGHVAASTQNQAMNALTFSTEWFSSRISRGSMRSFAPAARFTSLWCSPVPRFASYSTSWRARRGSWCSCSMAPASGSSNVRGSA